MIRGLYTAWTGMRSESKRLDVIANNVANASTTGYKQEGVTNQSFDDTLAIKIRDKEEGREREIGKMTLGVKIGEVYTDYSQGSLRPTDNTFDLGINGKGFFRVRVVDANGDDHLRYTRAGNFTLTADGYVTDADGNHLQSEGGDLIVPTDEKITFREDGTICANGEPIDKLYITDFENYDFLKKYADTMYEPVEGATETEAEYKIMQGYLEQSNVNVVREMVQMIAVSRAYEANQKILKTMDSTLDNSINSVGNV